LFKRHGKPQIATLMSPSGPSMLASVRIGRLHKRAEANSVISDAPNREGIVSVTLSDVTVIEFLEQFMWIGKPELNPKSSEFAFRRPFQRGPFIARSPAKLAEGISGCRTLIEIPVVFCIDAG
jgi:hypothetical protein